MRTNREQHGAVPGSGSETAVIASGASGACQPECTRPILRVPFDDLDEGLPRAARANHEIATFAEPGGLRALNEPIGRIHVAIRDARCCLTLRSAAKQPGRFSIMIRHGGCFVSSNVPL